MNRTLRWLYRTRLNREQFNLNLNKKRMQQLDADYREYQKRHKPLSMALIIGYLEAHDIPYTRQRRQDDETLYEYNIEPIWFSDLQASGIHFNIEGIPISVKNFVYYKSLHSFRNFTCLRIGDRYELKNWIEHDILNLLPHLPDILNEWHNEDMIIDHEFKKREKIIKLNLLRCEILRRYK